MKFAVAISLVVLSVLSCTPKIITSEHDLCDEGGTTIMTAKNWTGPLGYYNDLRRWAVNVPIPNTIDGVRTCIVCTNIPDSLRTIGRMVTFSGELKQNGNLPKPELGGQEIYYVIPTELK